MPATATPTKKETKSGVTPEEQAVRDTLPSEEDVVKSGSSTTLRNKKGQAIPNFDIDPKRPADEGDAGATSSEEASDSGLDPILLGYARTLSVSDSRVGTFTSNEALHAYLEGVADTSERRAASADLPGQPVVPEQRRTMTAKDLEDRNFVIKDAALEADGEYGEEVVKMDKNVRGFIDHQNKQMRELETIIGNMYTHVAASQQAQTQSQADVYFSAHPEHADVFGEGSTASLDKYGEHSKNRRSLEKFVARQVLGYKAQQQQAPDFATMADEGVPGLFSKETASRMSRDFKKKADKRAKQATHPPGPKVADNEISGRDRAIAGVSAYLREAGVRN